MNQVTDESRRVRVGMFLTAATAMFALLAITEPLGDDAWKVWAIVAVGGVTGVGLLVRAWFARVLAGALFAAALVFGLRSFVLALTDSWAGFELDWIVAAANAAATTVLLSWLSVRAIQLMIGTAWAAGVTVRLVGGTLLVVAASHLWWAVQAGFGSQGSLAMDISPEGARMIGFPGWPLWHAALLIAALGLLVAPRRLLRHIATALAVLFVALMGLVSVAAVRLGMFDLLPVLVVVALTLVPAALAWWLRDELRDVAS